MTKYAYFPGCSLETSAKEYDASMRSVCKKLGVELAILEDWSCCGSSPTHKVDKGLGVLVAGRNLSLAQSVGDIVAPCASCFSSLKQASIVLDKNKSLQRSLLEANYAYKPGGVKVFSSVEAIYWAIKEDLLEGKIVTPLTGLKVASYYGCLLVRPPKVASLDDPENPTSMDEIMQSIGAEAVGWSHKSECCGNSYILVDRDMTNRMVSNILNAAIEAGADIIATACPLCEQNLGLRQGQLEKKYGLKRKIPVVYFTQLMGVSMGIDEREISLDADVVKLVNTAKSSKGS